MGIVSAIQISIEYSQMISQAKRLDSAASLCGEAANVLRSNINNIPEYWQGEAADAMYLKLVDQYKEYIAIERELSSTASQIRSKAEAIKAADDSAASSMH